MDNNSNPFNQFQPGPAGPGFTPPEPSPPPQAPQPPVPPQPIPPEPSQPVTPPAFMSEPVPPAPAMPVPAAAEPGLTPQPVVLVLSPRGVEYVFMTIALLTGAIGLIVALISLFNGETDFKVLAFPTALLLVSVPIFAALFLRLKQAELKDPSLGLDASKRRSTQFIQIVSFLTCFFSLIGLVTTIFAKMSGDYSGSLGKVILDILVIVAVAGGILFYYWRDEHKA